MRIPCPHCGERGSEEFSYLGAADPQRPAADAPIETDMAANSDSTLMNSHGERVPAFTIAPMASMMWVWGEIG